MQLDPAFRPRQPRLDQFRVVVPGISRKTWISRMPGYAASIAIIATASDTACMTPGVALANDFDRFGVQSAPNKAGRNSSRPAAASSS